MQAPSPAPRPHSRLPPSLAAILTAAALVLLLAHFTNRLNPQWDTLYYQDMAANGTLGNHHLVAPFAYRPAAPLLIGILARAAHAGYDDTFRLCAEIMSAVFIVV